MHPDDHPNFDEIDLSDDGGEWTPSPIGDRWATGCAVVLLLLLVVGAGAVAVALSQ